MQKVKCEMHIANMIQKVGKYIENLEECLQMQINLVQKKNVDMNCICSKTIEILLKILYNDKNILHDQIKLLKAVTYCLDSIIFQSQKIQNELPSNHNRENKIIMKMKKEPVRGLTGKHNYENSRKQKLRNP